MPKEITIGRPPVYIHEDGRVEELPIHKEFIDSKARRKIAVFHRRGRKTSISLEEVFKYLAVNPKIVGKTLAPIRKQAKEIIWDDPQMLFSILPPELIQDINKTDLKITLKNGSIWYLDGADQPNFQRGGNVKVLHLAETGDHREEIWNQIYEPVLTLNKGVAIFEGNPRGQNWYYRLYQAAAYREGWDRFLLSAADSPIFTKAQLEDIRLNNPENVFKAEYLCEWIGSTGTVFRTFREIATVAQKTEAERGRKYKMGIDLAKLQDYTVLSVVDRHNWEQVSVIRFNQLDWVTQKERIWEEMKRWSSRKNGNSLYAIIETNGPGDPIFDDLWRWAAKEKDYDITIQPFNQTNSTKALLVSNLSMLCDQRFIGLRDDEDEMKEFEVFTYNKTRDHYIYGAPDGLHDDIIMATMLSFWELGAKLPLPEEPKIESLIERLSKAQNINKSSDLQNYLLR